MCNISFGAPKCAKNGLLRALLIFAHLWYAKINGIIVLPNMSSSKDNQTKKVSQLIECNIRNIFMKKYNMQIMVEKLFADLFLKNKNWSNLWNKISKFYTVCSYCSFYVEGYLKISKLYFRLFAFISHKAS